MKKGKSPSTRLQLNKRTINQLSTLQAVKVQGGTAVNTPAANQATTVSHLTPISCVYACK